MREVSKELIMKIDMVQKQEVPLYKWEQFYEFIILSFNKPIKERFSISGLFYELQSRQIDEASEMMKIYAHGMYILAKNSNLRIYGDDFNA